MEDIAEKIEEGDVVRIDFERDYGTHEGEVVGVLPDVGPGGEETEVDVQLADAGETDYAPSEDSFLIDLVTITHNVDDELTASGLPIHQDEPEWMGGVDIEVVERGE